MNNYKTFFAAYKASVLRGNNLSKEEVVLQFTSGRTSSLKELKPQELTELTTQLNYLNGTDKRNWKSAPGEQQRRQIIAIAHEMRWELPDGKADMKRINTWIATFGYLRDTGKHQDINAYSYEELPKLVWQFKQAHKHYLSNI